MIADQYLFISTLPIVYMYVIGISLEIMNMKGVKTMPIPAFDMKGNMLNVEVSEVICIYRDEKTRRIIIKATNNGEYYLPSTIKQINELMARSGFFQIDKNKIINLSQIKNYENGHVTLDGSTYTVSRRNRAELESILDID